VYLFNGCAGEDIDAVADWYNVHADHVRADLGQLDQKLASLHSEDDHRLGVALQPLDDPREVGRAEAGVVLGAERARPGVEDLHRLRARLDLSVEVTRGGHRERVHQRQLGGAGIAEDAIHAVGQQRLEEHVAARPAEVSRQRRQHADQVGDQRRERRLLDAEVEPLTEHSFLPARLSGPVMPVSSLSLNLPNTDGSLQTYRLAASRSFPAKLEGTLNRVAFSAAHVVCDPLADTDPWLTAAVDWDKTLAFREHVWDLGLGVAEAMTLAGKAGVDPAKVRAALLGGFAQSRVLELHGQRMLDHNFEPGFRTRLYHKDMGIVMATGRAAGNPDRCRSRQPGSSIFQDARWSSAGPPRRRRHLRAHAVRQ